MQRGLHEKIRRVEEKEQVVYSKKQRGNCRGIRYMSACFGLACVLSAAVGRKASLIRVPLMVSVSPHSQCHGIALNPPPSGVATLVR